MAFLLTKVNLWCLLLFIIFPSYFSTTLNSQELNQKDSSGLVWLTANTQLRIKENTPFQIFCYKNIPKSFLYLWRSVYLAVENVPLSYEIFSGVNGSEVKEKLAAKSVWYPSNWFSGQKTSIDFPAFSQYCVGIATTEQYAIQLRVLTVNYWRVLQSIIGVLLFLSAPSLSRNPFFHYTSAVSLGVLGSVLVLLYVISKFIPKRTTSYAVLVFGYSFILYILQILWKDLHEIISKYMDVVLAYCLCAAFVSFVVCYRLGPVQNVRTFNIIQWSMQVNVGSEYIVLSFILLSFVL